MAEVYPQPFWNHKHPRWIAISIESLVIALVLKMERIPEKAIKTRISMFLYSNVPTKALADKILARALSEDDPVVARIAISKGARVQGQDLAMAARGRYSERYSRMNEGYEHTFSFSNHEILRLLLQTNPPEDILDDALMAAHE